MDVVQWSYQKYQGEKMSIPTRVNIKLWLDHQGNVQLGAGRAELLRRVGELGSLKKAAESLGMSYRAAWGRIKRIEEALGIAMVEAAGARRDGYQLTPEGRELVDAFMLWYEDVCRYALEKAAHLPMLHAQGVEAHHRQASSDDVL